MERHAFTVGNVRSAALRALNYSPAIEKIRSTPGGSSVPLSSMLKAMGPAYGTVFTRIDCDQSHGIELLSQADMFGVEPKGRVIRRDSMAHPDRHEIHRHQILVAGAGTLGENEIYGRSLIADARLVGKYVGPDSMTLVLEDPEADQSLFAYAFLTSPTGVAAIRSTSYGTKILRFREDLLGSLPIPIAPKKVVVRVATLIREAVAQRELYYCELIAARRPIEELPEMQVAREMCAAQTPKVVIWTDKLPTLRAWNFASTGGALAYLRSKWSGHLGDALEKGGLFKGGRLTRVACKEPHGVDLLSQRDVFAIRPIPRRIKRPPDSQLEVDESMLLLASRGQMNDGALFGRVERACHMPTGAIVTEDITRIRPLRPLHEGLYAFLSTSIGLALLRSTAYGTSIPGMRVDLLEQLPIPDAHHLAKSQKHVRAASTARNSAARAELEAVRIIEQEVLPAWLA